MVPNTRLLPPTCGGIQQLGDQTLSPPNTNVKKKKHFSNEATSQDPQKLFPNQIKWATDLAKSTALGYGYKSEPIASGLGAHSWAQGRSNYLLSAWRDFVTTSPLRGRPRWQQSGDLEIKDYKNIAKAGEESERPKHGQPWGRSTGGGNS